MTDTVTVTIDKLVHGGQGLGELENGKKIFVWNALPGEVVQARIIKKKRAYCEAIAEEITIASPHRQPPQEANYLATSPWQIMDYAYENEAKRTITLDAFAAEKVTLPAVGPTVQTDSQWQYRNKMEYSFWGDDDGLHLALHQRGSHGKQIVTGSKLAMPAIDAAAQAVCAQLQTLGVRAGDLKTVVVRCSQAGVAVAAVFVKSESFPELELTDALQGLRVYYSNPKSPASVPTKLLQEIGIVTLIDQLLGRDFSYDVDSFFQVNIPIFELALTRIAQHNSDAVLTDMYAGVGSIGLSLAQQAVTLVELDESTAAMAAVNAQASSLQVSVVQTSAERSLDFIANDTPVVVDPPRAGLHKDVTERLLQALPPKIVYLSCNPSTQARDIALLQGAYDIQAVTVFNFFPKTPHIECLALLVRRP